MHIRPYPPADRQVLKDITTRTFRDVSIDGNIEKQFGLLNGTDWAWRKCRQIDADCDLQPDGILVVEEQGRVIGFISTRLDADTKLGWIANLAVDPQYQGRGIGRRLIEAALELFRQRGMTHAKIETLEQNPVGRTLYRKCGFEEVARQIHFVRRL